MILKKSYKNSDYIYCFYRMYKILLWINLNSFPVFHILQKFLGGWRNVDIISICDTERTFEVLGKRTDTDIKWCVIE